MLLNFADQSPFATGVASYDYNGVPGSDASARIILEVIIEGQPTTAILDTGAPYLICSPALVEVLRLNPSAALARHTMLIRGYKVKGDLYRVALTIPAKEGMELSLEVMAFVPAAGEQYMFPSFLGLLGCLEWVRFAIDPLDNKFYFGQYG